MNKILFVLVGAIMIISVILTTAFSATAPVITSDVIVVAATTNVAIEAQADIVAASYEMGEKTW